MKMVVMMMMMVNTYIENDGGDVGVTLDDADARW